MAIKDWPGGVMSDEPVVPAGNLQTDTASGVWTLDQAADYVKQGSWPTAGNVLNVEDVFSTYLYEGTTTSQSITGTGVDVTEEGGLVWIKNRTVAWDNALFDTINTGYLKSNNTAALASNTQVTLEADGFSFSGGGARWNNSGDNYASWTFRKAEKFFDVVTYTGTGDAAPGQTVAHNLGSTPGFMIIKRTDTTSDWSCYHSGLTSNEYYLKLNGTNSETEDGTVFPSAPTGSNFYVRADRVNASGGTFVAYLFASDAGGFGDDDENIIKCGSWDENSTNNVAVDCGFEPDFVMFKCADAASAWYMADSMRTVPTPSSGTATGNYIDTILQANTNAAEGSANAISLTSTGFIWYADGRLTNTAKWIYIAIRRPMKTPESGTEVFAPVGATSTAPLWKSSFPVDAGLYRYIIGTSAGTYFGSRLTGTGRLESSSTAAEATDSSFKWDYMNGWFNNSFNDTNYVGYNFKRATGFMDVVAYTGTGSATTQAHNLGVVPELMIVKCRSNTANWAVYVSDLGATKNLYLDINNGFFTQSTIWNNTSPSDTSITLGTSADVNYSGLTYIAYLFATLAGVSKVGSYTGTAADLNVDCGFSAGARFILIKRTDATGDWYTYDSFRGIVAGNDPYILMNTTAAQVTNTDYIDPLASGFTVTSSAPAALNASGGSYIFLAIA